MASIRYYNQTGPFWDFVAGMEEQGQSHPFAANRNENHDESEEGNASPWAGFMTHPFGPFASRPRHGHGPHGRRDHGPYGRRHHGPPPPPHSPDDHEKGSGGEDEHGPEGGPSEPRSPPPPFSEKPGHGPHGHAPHGHGPDEHDRRGGPGGFRGRCGGRGGRKGWGGRGEAMGGLGGLAELFQSQFFGEDSANTNEDFKPEVDVFDAPESFVVHISLPGAKKEDVGVNWDAEKSELSIAGVIYRPGGEELVKSLALNERKVGAFERKVRLGSRANPAQIDVDGISAKMEDGVLRVDVPKMDGGFVEIRKVDIE